MCSKFYKGRPRIRVHPSLMREINLLNDDLTKMGITDISIPQRTKIIGDVFREVKPRLNLLPLKSKKSVRMFNVEIKEKRKR